MMDDAPKLVCFIVIPVLGEAFSDIKSSGKGQGELRRVTIKH